MNARNEAFDILANQGKAAFVRHCEAERNAAKTTGYEGAAEFWQKLLNEVAS